MFSKRLTALLLATSFVLFSWPALGQSLQQFESVIIQAGKPYTKLSSDIQALGGVVTYQYKYVDAIAAKIPSNAMDRLATMVGAGTISKDLILPSPTPKRLRSTKGNSFSPTSNLNTNGGGTSAAYMLNNLGLNIEQLHGKGYTGAGVIVAVIDSGVRPNYPVLNNSVIGGIDLVGDGFGFSNSNNDPHGTFVSGLISGNALINVQSTTLETSVRLNFPGALVGSDLPLIGTAPASRLYEVRVFGANALAGAPESRLIAAIDHVIDQRVQYLKGDPAGLNIQVCNLSLGNTTLYAGRDVFDLSVSALLANGIIPVVSAGDGGPSGLTVSSPATSLSSIAVGAASPAANERVQIDLDPFFGLGFGVRYRPNGATQVAFFSSRGPNADGRISPDVVAVGVGNFGQGYGSTTDVDVVSGTSFSAPLVTGVAAVLRQAFPTASANQIRNAIIGSGNPSMVGSRFTQFDQGTGFPDAQVAFDNFATFPSSPPDFGHPKSTVAANIKKETNLDVESGSVNRSTGSLAPGQRSEILYLIKEDTSRVVITVSNFKSDPNVSPLNLFPEEIYLKVHSAKTSQIGAFGDYFDIGDPFITGGTFTINNPEPGIMRITLSGAYTNEKSVSADVVVNSFKTPTPGHTTNGIIDNHQQIVFPVTIPPGVSVAEFRLSFGNDWGSYPTSDLDMILFDPNLNRNTDGAHLNAPERATVLNPIPGTWLVLINGFDIPAGSDKYELRVALDGKVIK